MVITERKTNSYEVFFLTNPYFFLTNPDLTSYKPRFDFLQTPI